MQDHERAYFDSADWVLGKVRKENPKKKILHQYSGMVLSELRLHLILALAVPLAASCK